MATYYVATTGDSDNNSGTSGSPWGPTINSAILRAELGAGDTLIVKSGTYNENVIVGKSGSSGSHIILKSETKWAAKVNAGGSGIGIQANGNYITIDGFEVYNGGSSGINATDQHHITVKNCKSRDNDTGGIYMQGCEDVLVENNVCYGNCSGGVNSNISIHKPKAWTSGSGFRTTVRGNTCYNAQVGTTNTDSNGIIFDEWNVNNYTRQGLIERNICYSNAGDGIVVYDTQNAEVRYNTCWNNNQNPNNSSTWKFEICISNSDNVEIHHNIMKADTTVTGTKCYGNVSNSGVTNSNIDGHDNCTWANSTGYASQTISSGNAALLSTDGNLLGVPPSFLNPPTTFALKDNSPCPHMGVTAP